MELNEALAFIHATDWKGSRLGLERMRELMHRLGNPQDSLKFIHVAGTNGKGSTSTMLASILTAAGYKTGLYTSPHLVRVNERFRINGADIPDAALCRAAEAVKEAAGGMSDAPTEFEILTAMGFRHFAAEKCDAVVLEVGLGGRLDATNAQGRRYHEHRPGAHRHSRPYASGDRAREGRDHQARHDGRYVPGKRRRGRGVPGDMRRTRRGVARRGV